MVIYDGHGDIWQGGSVSVDRAVIQKPQVQWFDSLFTSDTYYDKKDHLYLRHLQLFVSLC